MRTEGLATIVFLLAYVVIALKFDLLGANAQFLEAGLCQPLLLPDEPWRILSAQFVHAGLLHLALNGYFLWRVGPALEHALGTERFVLLYLTSGAAGFALTSLAHSPWYPGAVGGSGALFGMMGALIAMQLRAGRSYRGFLDHAAGRGLLQMTIVMFLIGFIIPRIDNWGHAGGLIGGFLLTFFCFRLPEAGGRSRRPPLLGMASCALLLVGVCALAVHPVHRAWFAARTHWFSTDPARVEALDSYLEQRGVTTAAREFLVLTKALRANDSMPAREAWARHFVEHRMGIIVGLASAHCDPAVFEGLRKALANDERDATTAIPYDPWTVGRR